MAAVRTVNEQAFGQPAEAGLVEMLRASCGEALSLVAEDAGVVVEGDAGRVAGMGLAPLAVHPDRQREGIGSRLVERGLEILRGRGCPFVVVVGHPGYYPRFGFERASARGLSSQWPGVDDAAFMVRVLDPPAMTGVSGVARYREEFDAFA